MMRYRTQRLEIRPFEEKDRENMIDLFMDCVVKQTYMLPDFASREEAGKLFERLLDLSQKEDRYVAAICLDGVCIGILNETEISGESIELGYALLSRHHNKGYCTEALAGAIQWLQDRGFREVVTGAFEENLASIRVMEKCAMERLDKTDEIEYRGKVHRCVYYAKRISRRIFDTLVEKELIDKGWSGDKKYRAVSDKGEVYLLRIAPMERLERKRLEFGRMQTVAELGIPMCLPVEFGECADGVYAIQSWIEGEDAEETVSKMDGKTQYAYGLDAGRILAKIHTLPAPADTPDWEPRFNAKIDRKIAMYEKCPLKYDVDEPMLRYLAENRHLLANRPQSYQHGDYHVGNMMIDRDGKLTIIDFEKDDYGDPWEEFNRIVWCAQAAPSFASGMVDGYFGGEVPMEFWKLLALYICSNTLGSLPWAIPFGETEIAVMRDQQKQVLGWYDNMTNPVPAWYRKGGN